MGAHRVLGFPTRSGRIDREGGASVDSDRDMASRPLPGPMHARRHLHALLACGLLTGGRVAVAEEPSADTPPAELSPELVGQLQRGHLTGVVGHAMTGTGVAMTVLGVGLLNSATTYDRTTGRPIYDDVWQARYGSGLTVLGPVLVVSGQATTYTSALRNGTRLHRLDPQHTRTAAWSGLAALPVGWALLGADVGGTGWTGVALGGGGLLAGGIVQHVFNARKARALGVGLGLDNRRAQVHLQLSPDGLRVAGRF